MDTKRTIYIGSSIMAYQRTKNELADEALVYKGSLENIDEWKCTESAERIEDAEWIKRYDRESGIVSGMCKEYKLKKILEFGSGPGKFADMVQKQIGYDVSYTMIDKYAAKELFIKNNFKGKFLVKDLMNYVDTSDLDDDYDFIIANDFLEHIANPSNILSESYKITTDNARFFVSVPNWRMGHTFIYRGLFDWDNIIYTMEIHGWKPTEMWRGVHGVNPNYKSVPKLTSEDDLPEEFKLSWNWYIGCKKIKIEQDILEVV
jgi:SAM-dependent methyltransferase